MWFYCRWSFVEDIKRLNPYRLRVVRDGFKALNEHGKLLVESFKVPQPSKPVSTLNIEYFNRRIRNERRVNEIVNLRSAQYKGKDYHKFDKKKFWRNFICMIILSPNIVLIPAVLFHVHRLIFDFGFNPIPSWEYKAPTDNDRWKQFRY